MELEGAGPLGVAGHLLGRAVVESQLREYLTDAADIGDRIGENLRHQSARVGTGEPAPVVDIPGQGRARAAVGLRGEDQTHQALEVVAVLDQVGSQRRHERLVAGWIADTEVVDRLDEADGEVVGPHPVDDRAGEVGVVGRGEPGGESLAAVGGGLEWQGRCVERGGGLRLASARLKELAGILDKQRPLAVTTARVAPPALGADAREEVGKGVVLVVGPFLEGVVVALRAADREAQESLAGVLSHRLRVLVDGEEICGAVVEARAARRDDVAGESVPGDIRGHPVADPAVVGVDGLGPELRAGDEENVAPFIAPVIDELGARKEQLDEPLVLPRRGIGEKGPDLLGGREPADRVEEGAADEGGVVAGGGGLEVELLELGEDEGVDEVGPGGGGKRGGRNVVGEGGDDAGDADSRGEPSGDGPGAVADRRDGACQVGRGGRIDGGHRFVSGGKPGPARDVAGGAVGVAGGDGEPGGAIFLKGDFRWGDVDPDEGLLGGGRAGAAGGDPGGQEGVVGA